MRSLAYIAKIDHSLLSVAPLSDRTWQADTSYRFGFNGKYKYKDNEIKGDGNSYDFGARIYDSRLGRFSSTDRKGSIRPSNTGYESASNNPIHNIDVNGDFAVPVIYFAYEGAVIAVGLVASYFIAKELIEHPLSFEINTRLVYASYSPE